MIRLMNFGFYCLLAFTLIASAFCRLRFFLDFQQNNSVVVHPLFHTREKNIDEIFL